MCLVRDTTPHPAESVMLVSQSRKASGNGVFIWITSLYNAIKSILEIDQMLDSVTNWQSCYLAQRQFG